MKTYQNIPIPHPVEGTIRTAAIDDAVAPTDSLELGLNFNFDSMGASTGRPGLVQYTATNPENNPITNFGVWAQNATANRRLLAQVDDTVYSWNGAAWANVRNLTNAVNKARFTQFLNLTYMVNGFDGDVIQSFDGTNFGVTQLGDLVGLKLDNVDAGFEGRIWGLDRSTDRLYYTDIVDPSGNIPVSGSPQYIEKLSPQDGQSMTALVRAPRALLVFKQNSIFRVYSANSLDPYPAYLIGTYSQESVIKTKEAIYFHHPTGFYKFQYDGQPQEISRRIIDFIKGISRTNYEKVFAWNDGDHVYWNVGNVTIKERTYENVVCRFTISSQVWTIYSYRKNLTAAIIYDDGNNILPLAGTSLGFVARTDIGTNDLGDEIFCELISRWMTFDEVTGLTCKWKNISGLAAHHENCSGFKLGLQYDKGESKLQPVGSLTESYVDTFTNFNSDNFFRVRYCLSGTYKNALPIFESPEIINLQDIGFENN